MVWEVSAEFREEFLARRQRAILVSVDGDVGEGEASLAFIGDEVEYVGAEGFEYGLAVFAYEVGVRSSCECDSEVRG
jgi:hypothetical protein